MKQFFGFLLVLLCLLAGCAATPEAEVPATTTEPAPTMPERPIVAMDPTVGFAWDVRDGVAFLTDLGEVTQTDIVIPARVSLIQTDSGWTEDTESGTEYPVTVCSTAFNYCQELTTVTFNSGVVIENNRMSKDSSGMFTFCKALTAVYNIPDAVTDMASAFSYCQALTEIDRFPYRLTDLKGCFRGCTALSEVPALPDSVTNMAGCFVECTSLTSVPELPHGLTDMQNCFRDCTALTEAPALPDSVESVANCFAGCVSLTYVPNLPASATDMRGCFQGCTSLVQVPEFPAGVTDLSNCFQDCTSLVSVPPLPDSVITMAKCFWRCTALENIEAFPAAVKSLDGCFVGCESLQSIPALPATVENIHHAFIKCLSLRGTIEIPKSVTEKQVNTWAFWGCCEIDEIIFDTCPLGEDIGNYLKHEVKTTFRYDHIEEGECPYCGKIDEEIPAPPSLYTMENIPEYYETWFIDYIENAVPSFLKENCKQYVFTNDIEEYNPWDFSVVGLAFGTGEIYIQLQRSNISHMKYTIYHELGHRYDWETQPIYDILLEEGRIVSMGYSPMAGDFCKYSGTDEWKALHQSEGKTASRWYGDSYKTFTEEEKRRETFAIAVGKYFTDPSALESRCPGMYAYVDALFRDLIAAEEAAKAAETPAA